MGKKKSKIKDPITEASLEQGKKVLSSKMSEEDDYDCNTFSPYMATPEDSLQKDIEAYELLEAFEDKYPLNSKDIEAVKESYNDQETQDWMNASLGKPMTKEEVEEVKRVIDENTFMDHTKTTDSPSMECWTQDKDGNIIVSTGSFTFTTTDSNTTIIAPINYDPNVPATSGFSQPLFPKMNNFPLIGEDRLSEILFEELLKFKKSKGYAANSPVDLKEIADNVAKSFVVDLLDK